MWQAILRFLGLGKRPGEGPSGVPKYTKKNVRTSAYYRRGGNFYTFSNDELVEDLLLIAILSDYYDEGLITESYPEPDLGEADMVDTSVEGRTEPEIGDIDILDVDGAILVVSAEKVTNWKVDVPAEEYVEPSRMEPDPEPTKSTSYSSGYSDSSSSYDSGSCDSGGGCD